MKPLVERLEKEYKGRVEFRTYLDPGTNGSDPVGTQLADDIGLQYYPTFLFVNADGTLSEAPVVGGQSEDQLRARLGVLAAGNSSAPVSSGAQEDGASLVAAKCGARCHGLEPITPGRDERAWADTINRMNAEGAQVSESDKRRIVDYLTTLN